MWQFHTVPHPGEFGYETWPKDAYKYVGGVNTWGEITVDAEAGHRLLSPRVPHLRLLRSRPARREPVRQLDRRARRANGQAPVALPDVHHDLWDFDGNAAPQLTTIKRNGKSIDVVAVAGKTGFLYVFDRVTGEPIWPIEERPVPKSDMPGEQSWPTQPFPTTPPPFSRQSFTVDDINPHPIVSDARTRDVQAAPRRVAQSGTVHPDPFRRHAAHPGQQRRRALRLHGGGTGQRRGLRHQPGQPGHPPSGQESAGRRGPPGAGRVPARMRGLPRTGPERHPRAARPCWTCPGRLDAATVRATIMNGKGRMPAFPHIDRRRDGDARHLSRGAPGAAFAGRGRGAAIARSRRGRSSAREARGCGPGRAGGRGRAGGPRPYPDGVEQTPQYVINAYGTIGTMMKPPFTKLIALRPEHRHDQVAGGPRRRCPAGGAWDHRDWCAADEEQPDRDVRRPDFRSRAATANCARTTPRPARCCGRRRRSAARSAVATRCIRWAAVSMCWWPSPATRLRPANGRTGGSHAADRLHCVRAAPTQGHLGRQRVVHWTSAHIQANQERQQ